MIKLTMTTDTPKLSAVLVLGKVQIALTREQALQLLASAGEPVLIADETPNKPRKGKRKKTKPKAEKTGKRHVVKAEESTAAVLGIMAREGANGPLGMAEIRELLTERHPAMMKGRENSYVAKLLGDLVKRGTLRRKGKVGSFVYSAK